MQNLPSRFVIQDDQYKFPYHHLVDFKNFNNYVVMSWGFEYYAYMSKVISLIKGLNPNSLLDVGCGEGKMILELSKFIGGEKMIGIDLSERAILFAQAFNYGNGAIFEYRDIKTLNSEFEVITLVETMEHIPDDLIPEVVGNVRRLLKDEGRVIVTVPAKSFPVQSKHYRHYDIELILKQFEGFAAESLHYTVKNGFMHKMLIRLSRKFCSFKALRMFFFNIAKVSVFDAKPDNARHIVCVLKKI